MNFEVVAARYFVALAVLLCLFAAFRIRSKGLVFPLAEGEKGALAGFMRRDLTSLAMMGFAVLVLLLACVLLWRNRGALLGGRPRTLVRSSVSHER